MNLRCYSENTTVFLSVFYDLVLRSSSGVSLVNDTTTISASVHYSNDNELVDFDDSCFTWYKDGYDAVFKTGKSFQLSKADFASDSLTLKCTFNHPESSYQRSEYITITKASNGYSRAQLTLYKRSANGVPSKDDIGEISYTFATNAYTGQLGSWSTSIPAGTDDLYVIYASAFFNEATDIINANEWTNPAKLATEGAKGEDGMSVYSILLFKRASSIPSAPNEDVTYNFHTNVLSGAGGWYRDIPESDGNPLYAISATAASRSETDVIHPSEWSEPIVYVKDGEQGDKGEQGSDGYCYTVSVHSSNGNIFRMTIVDTTLSCQVLRNNEDITDTLPDSLFFWKRNSGDSVADERWNTSSKAMGHKTVHITNDDCVSRSTFSCEVEI